MSKEIFLKDVVKQLRKNLKVKVQLISVGGNESLLIAEGRGFAKVTDNGNSATFTMYSCRVVPYLPECVTEIADDLAHYFR